MPAPKVPGAQFKPSNFPAIFGEMMALGPGNPETYFTPNYGLRHNQSLEKKSFCSSHGHESHTHRKGRDFGKY